MEPCREREGAFKGFIEGEEGAFEGVWMSEMVSV